MAIVQIDFQPALAINHVAYLEEPTPLTPKAPQSQSLSGLAARGVNVIAMQRHCRERYVAWALARTEAILAYLATFDNVPDLILFPEASIPLDVLPAIATWARAHGTTVLAGTHSPQIHTQGRQFYIAAGVSRADVAAIGKWNSENILPAIQAERTRLYPKTLLSVHEYSDLAPLKSASKKTRKPLTVATADGSKLAVTPLICSEALQENGEFTKADVIGVVSLEDNPGRFKPWIQSEVAQRRVVLYCNGAHAGGSHIGITQDLRHPNWFAETFPDGLPPGEAILVADIDLDATAVETGVAAPRNPFQVVSVAGIVPSSPTEIGNARMLTAACKLTDPDVREGALKELIGAARPGSLLALRAQRLLFDASRGHPSDDAISLLGNDCFTDCPSLVEVQQELATACADKLTGLIALHGGDQETLSILGKLIPKYSKMRLPSAAPVPEGRSESRGFVDREEERSRLSEFVDSKTSVLLVVTGLPGAGKSALIAHGLDQLGLGEATWLGLDEATSAEFLFRRLAGDLAGRPPKNDNELRDRLARALKQKQIVVVDGSRLSMEYDRWAEPEVEGFIKALVEAARIKGARVIIESRRRLPIALDATEDSERLFVTGFDRRKTKYGLQIFESQLRRMSLPADTLPYQSKERLVALLSGNPKALELAAIACLDEGPDALVQSLERGAGNFPSQIRKLLRITRFSPIEQTALALLTRTRTDVPRSTLVSALGGDASESVASLIVSGAVEIHEEGLVGIANILRTHLVATPVDAEVEQRFHQAAASALAKFPEEELELRSASEYHARLAGLPAAKTRSTVPDSVLAAAQQLFVDQDYERAAKLVDEVLNVRPRWRPALRLGALVHARLRDRSKALTFAKAAFTADKRDPALFHDLGRVALTQNDESLMQGLIEVGLEVGLDETDVLTLRGRLQLRRKQLRAAEGSFQKACESARDAWPFVFLGETYMRMGLHDEAIDTFHEGEERHRRYRWKSRGPMHAIRVKLGLTYLLRGDVDVAASWIGKVDENERNPESARAHALLELIQQGVADLDKILDRLRLAKAKTNHDRSQVHLFAGELLRRQDRLEEAEQEYLRATDADRGDIYAWLRLAACSLEIARRRRSIGDTSAGLFAERALNAARVVLTADSSHTRAAEFAHAVHVDFPEVINDSR